MKWLFFAFALAYGDTCVQVGKPESGRIEVIAKDATGATLRNPRVELFEVGTRLSVDATQPIPYGAYELRVEVPGFRLLRREIHLYQSTLTVRAELSIGFGCGYPPIIRGKLKGVKRGSDLWVKAVPSLGTGGAESRVEANGNFLITGLEYGNYLLIATDGNKPVHIEALAVRGENKPIEIQLQEAVPCPG